MLHDISRLIKRDSRSLAMTRRGLLTSAAFAAIVAGTSSHPLSMVAFAGTGFTQEQKAMLLRIAWDIYPHERLLDNEPYQAVVDSLIAEAERDPQVAELMVGGLAELNKNAIETFKHSYLEVKNPDAREALLRAIQMTDFFQKIRGALLMGIYDNKSLWPRFGYEGSSWEKGGFIDRGFDRIDWF